MKARALLFGLNYAHCRDGTLRGCANDVRNMAAYLTSLGVDAEAYTDDENREETSRAGIVARVRALADLATQEHLDAVWIHYSGHGSHVRDTDGDELDGRDECLVPSDYEDAGFVRDEELAAELARFPAHTRVVCVFDCCHSGTMADLRYTYDAGSETVEELRAAANVPNSSVVTLSGCTDAQTSADAYNLAASEFAGALTTALLNALKEDATLLEDAFRLLDGVHARLRERGFSQKPRLAASFDLRAAPRLWPSATVATAAPEAVTCVVEVEATAGNHKKEDGRPRDCCGFM